MGLSIPFKFRLLFYPSLFSNHFKYFSNLKLDFLYHLEIISRVYNLFLEKVLFKFNLLLLIAHSKLF